MIPLRFDGDVAVFTTRDVDDYGYPEIYGYEKYIVIEVWDNFVSDYKMEQEREWKQVHRYSRLARFKSTLFQLLGDRGHVDTHIYSMVRVYLNPNSKNLWNDTRNILKHFKKRQCYNRIPKILQSLGYGRLYPVVTSMQIENIINDFQALSTRFESTKSLYGRIYFPSIRFTVLKLLELHSILPNYPVPFVRTARKSKALNTLWQGLLDNKNI